tara:strand:+ start:16866 stop:17105 length:240 start_codon:yes stop_codon:yes gene_type:complete
LLEFFEELDPAEWLPFKFIEEGAESVFAEGVLAFTCFAHRAKEVAVYFDDMLTPCVLMKLIDVLCDDAREQALLFECCE